MNAQSDTFDGRDVRYSTTITTRLKPRDIARTKPITAQDEQKVISAVLDPAWDFSTIDGVARRTDLSRTAVEGILERRQDLIRESLVPGKFGRRTFAARSRPITWRERLGLLRLFITKTYR